MSTGLRLASLALVALGLAEPRSRSQRPPHPGPPPPPPRPLIDALDRVLDRRDLLPATRADVEKIRDGHERAMRAARERVVEETLARLRPVLAPDDFARVEEEARRPPPRPFPAPSKR